MSKRIKILLSLMLTFVIILNMASVAIATGSEQESKPQSTTEPTPAPTPEEPTTEHTHNWVNTFGSIRKGKTTITTTVCTVHNVRQSLAKITFMEMMENVRFVAILLPMSISGNGTETNRTMLASILWSVPAVQAHRNLINFLRGTDK